MSDYLAFFAANNRGRIEGREEGRVNGHGK
jgi:hypothetical protein